MALHYLNVDELCKCGRTLPTITKILGRSRNMLFLPNGDKICPTFGELQFRNITNKIMRHQIIQKSLTSLEIRLQINEQNELSKEEENNLIELITKTVGYTHLSCHIIYVKDFPLGKFEVFENEIKNEIKNE